MAIMFSCPCGAQLRAGDELAGKKARCPKCSAIVPIPEPAPLPEKELTYGLAEPEPASTSVGPGSEFVDETELDFGGSTYHPVPTASRREVDRPRPASTRPTTASNLSTSDTGSIMEYAYLLLIFALVPLIFSLLGKEEKLDLRERVEQTLEKATPEEVARAIPILSKEETTLDDVITALPGGKLEGAHLSRDTTIHWIYAAIATVGFLLFIMLFFSVERSHPAHLFGVGLFTGTIGIIFLFIVQFCAQIRLNRIGGRGWFALILLVLTFIGWSYSSANDPDSSFLLSAFGFTFGVGLCEEFTKAIPLFFYFQRDAKMGWRGACLWGLASGIGFGVSEGVMYSARYYNGISGADIYVVRFISCVALHAMWSASVGIAIARNIEAYERVEDAGHFVLFMLRIIAVPMLLHGFYDTLLKKDMNGWALAVALASFGWLAMQIELARASHPHAGIRPTRTKLPAY
jgi:RsiW-degrading membrane proteinase PrsW (M82 family)